MEVVKMDSVAAVSRFLMEHPGAGLVAGGTDLIPRLNQKIESRALLCSIDGISELSKVQELPDGGVLIGAGVRLSEIPGHPLLAGYAALTRAAGEAASLQIRNRATLGGTILQENRCMYFNQSVHWSQLNRCFKLGGDQCFQYRKSPECVALFQSDAAPALMALGASAVVQNGDVRREFLLGELYLRAGKKNLCPGDVLTGVRLPPLREGSSSAYERKTLRGSFDFPLISCAVSLCERNGRVSSLRAVLGSAGVMPQEIPEAGELLIGLAAEALPQAAPRVLPALRHAVAPFRDTRVNGAVRTEMGGEVFLRAVKAAAEACGQK